MNTLPSSPGDKNLNEASEAFDGLGVCLVCLTTGLSLFVPVLLWNWYVAPAFHLPPLRWITVFGMFLVWLWTRFLSVPYNPVRLSATQVRDGIKWWSFVSLFTLVLGWLGHFLV
jgi:hypothetical protein